MAIRLQIRVLEINLMFNESPLTCCLAANLPPLLYSMPEFCPVTFNYEIVFGSLFSWYKLFRSKLWVSFSWALASGPGTPEAQCWLDTDSNYFLCKLPDPSALILPFTNWGYNHFFSYLTRLLRVTLKSFEYENSMFLFGSVSHSPFSFQFLDNIGSTIPQGS